MRPPSRTLSVDANILVGLSLGVRARGLVRDVAALRTLVLAEQAIIEARLVVERVARRGGAEALQILIASMTLIERADYADFLEDAARVLRNGPASRNGSQADAEILAVAWRYNADIWSHDRDFAGTGWPSWSSVNLAAALSAEQVAR